MTDPRGTRPDAVLRDENQAHRRLWWRCRARAGLAPARPGGKRWVVAESGQLEPHPIHCPHCAAAVGLLWFQGQATLVDLPDAIEPGRIPVAVHRCRRPAPRRLPEAVGQAGAHAPTPQAPGNGR